LSFRRKREATGRQPLPIGWIPASAGMTAVRRTAFVDLSYNEIGHEGARIPLILIPSRARPGEISDMRSFHRQPS
jgi:hypothetical protein